MVEPETYIQYEVQRREDGSLWELGRGAMGITYKAHDTTLRRTVALKVINSAYLQSKMAQERFVREARSAAALRHENVASVFYLGIAHERYFYTMEFVDGETVDAYVKRKGRLDPIQALDLVRQVCSALAAADKQQLVHRDLKPSNLMLPYDEDGEQVIKVIDFGLARSLKAGGEDSGILTKAGEFVGTPQYASPEQVEEADVDIRSDIYSLGVTLYFMLTGQPPFSGSTGRIAGQQLYEPLPTALLAKAPTCVVKLIQQMTEKDRNKRPQTPRDLERQITACLELIRAPSDNTAGQACGRHNSTQIGRLSGELEPGTVFLDTYRLVRELDELPEGRRFLAEDIRDEHHVSLLVLNPHFLLDTTRLAALEHTVDRLRKAPYPTLRAIYRLERTVDYSALVEEYVQGPTLRDLLRRRRLISAPEVAHLLVHLAPLADHAQLSGLQHLDFTLSGVQLNLPEVNSSETQSGLLLRPVTAWERLEVKVNGIAFSALVANACSWAGSATLITDSPDEGPRSSYVRLLSLLGHELLGGPRVKVETTGRFTPVAALSEDGNAVLRRGIIDEFSSAVEMARELAACVSADGRAVSQPRTETFSQFASSPPNPIGVRREVKTPEPAHVHAKHNILQIDWRWILAVALIALCGLGWRLSYYAIMGKRTPGSETIEKQHTVAEQSKVKEEPIATVPETRDAETPSPSVAVAPRASQEVSVVVAEPSLAPQTVVQTTQGPSAPNGAPATQANDPQTESSPTASGTPAGAGTAASNGPTEQNGNTLVTSEADGSTVVWGRQENATPAHSKSGHSLDSKTKHTKHAPQPPAHPGGFWQNLRKYFQ